MASRLSSPGDSTSHTPPSLPYNPVLMTAVVPRMPTRFSPVAEKCAATLVGPSMIGSGDTFANSSAQKLPPKEVMATRVAPARAN